MSTGHSIKRLGDGLARSLTVVCSPIISQVSSKHSTTGFADITRFILSLITFSLESFEIVVSLTLFNNRGCDSMCFAKSPLVNFINLDADLQRPS